MHVLIAEDDPETAGLVARVLRDEGHAVEIATQGQAALERLVGGRFDILVLDRMLPELDGLAVLRAARAAGLATRVLMLTALGSIANRVEGLEAGADDYLLKPFAITELLARIRALQRRIEMDVEPTILSNGPFTLNLIRRELRYNGQFVALQPRELRLLEELLRNSGQILTRAMLLQRIWGFHFEPQTNLVETHLSRLRSKLALVGAKDVIRTIRGTGYCLEIDG